MFNLTDVAKIEGEAETSDAEYYCALQRAINSGSAWSLQGSYGRSMMAAIEDGACMLGQRDARDYYGNHIPSRDQIQEGSKGSRGYVVANRGEEWAVMLDGVDLVRQ